MTKLLKKSIFAGVMALAVMLTIFRGDALESRAAGKEETLMLIGGYDDAGDVVCVVPAFAVDEGDSILIIAGIYDYDECDQIRLVGSEVDLDITDVEITYNDSLNIVFWQVENTGEFDLPQDACPVQGETAEVVYMGMDSNDEPTIEMSEITLEDWQGDLGLVVDGLPDNIGAYPAVVLNEAGDCVGAVIEEDTVIALYGDADDFYGEGAGSEDEDEDEEEPDAPEPDEPEEPDVPESDGSDGPDKKEDSDKEAQIFIIAGVLLCVGAALLFLAWKKKKKTESGPARQNPADPVPVNPAPVNPEPANPEPWFRPEDISPTEPPDMEDIGPTTPVDPVPQKTGLWLVAQGGYMNGRIYPIERTGITIGRDISNMVNYPKDTRGVSRTHAKLYWDQNHLMLMDLNSTSGTFIQGFGKLQPMQPVEVSAGSVFYIGEKKNAFVIKQ